MKATEDSVRKNIEQGLQFARDFFSEMVKRTDDISDIRCCSFKFELIHIEVRWDWQKDKLFLELGTPSRKIGRIDTKGYATKGCFEAARLVMELVNDYKRTYIYCCVLGE